MQALNPTAENVRFHAAGHIAAAGIAAIHSADAAQQIMAEVIKFIDHPSVNAPPQVREKAAACADDPNNNLMNFTLLERWFVDPLNTVIEKTGGF